MDRSQPLTEALFYILLAARKPVHGYGIIQEVYGAINVLLDRGWIVLYSAEMGSRRKKEYVITDQGRAAFAGELRRLRELVSNGGKMEDET